MTVQLIDGKKPFYDVLDDYSQQYFLLVFNGRHGIISVMKLACLSFSLFATLREMCACARAFVYVHCSLMFSSHSAVVARCRTTLHDQTRYRRESRCVRI